MASTGANSAGDSDSEASNSGSPSGSLVACTCAKLVQLQSTATLDTQEDEEDCRQGKTEPIEIPKDRIGNYDGGGEGSNGGGGSGVGSGNTEIDKCLVSSEDGLPSVTLSAAPEAPEDEDEEDLGNGITVVSLQVPFPKSNRSASIDASFANVDLPKGDQLFAGKTQRSHSVDISLPTKPDGPYRVIPKQKPEQILIK